MGHFIPGNCLIKKITIAYYIVDGILFFFAICSIKSTKKVPQVPPNDSHNEENAAFLYFRSLRFGISLALH